MTIHASGRMMVFVDGENLVFRYQEMLKQGYTPHDDVIHLSDIFVWVPGLYFSNNHLILRATYYTYATGEENYIDSIKERIKSLSYNRPSRTVLPNHLYPQVFRKIKKDRKSKGVDIQMTVDILTHVFQNNIDCVYLMSGDGDNKPIIETVVRNGKQIYLAAFSSGLNPNLKHLPDTFTLLDHRFFKYDPNGNQMNG